MAGVVYLSFHFIVPGIQFDNLILQGLAPQAPMFGNFFSLMIVGCAAISGFKSSTKCRRLDSQKDIDSIRMLNWKKFEELVGEAYLRQGYQIFENQGGGPDGGIDLVLKKDGITTLVQCKHWKNIKVGVKVVRELFGVMTAKRAGRGIVLTSGEFTRDAIAFAGSNSIELVDGATLLRLIGEVQKEPKIEKPAPQTARKVCPACGADMVLRVARKGQHAGQKFWGCSDFPKCRKIEKIME
ncbi:MAG: restriction endonuclease [Desulfurivibrionaceae bacterium]